MHITRWIPRAIFAISLALPSLDAQFVQQGQKLVGTGSTGGPPIYQGDSVAISSDGNTAIEGGNGDNNFQGAAWIFTRAAGAWTQQGNKLVPSDSASDSEFGNASAISADGNTAIIGGPGDNSEAGAAWIFRRSNNTWTQQGTKFSGSGADQFATQGYAVAMSGDGTTAVVGGPGGILEGSGPTSNGAVWVFTAPNWTEQGQKLVGTGANGLGQQGFSVAVSSDGNTLIEGGPADNNNQGAAWVFTRSNGAWTQQGSKLTVAGAGASYFGASVAISADGNTAVVGTDSGGGGAGAFVFTRSNGTWTQQAALMGTGAVGSADQGFSVAISAAGNTVIVGGEDDNNNAGAAWIFTRTNGAWTQQGNKLVGTGASGTAKQGWAVALSGDGSTAMVGGSDDSGLIGAVWIFAAPASSGPSPVSLTPSVSTGATQTLTAAFNAPAGFTTLDVVNVLINTALDGRQACYLAYKQSTNFLYIVADNGDASQVTGKVMDGTGTVSNSQCTVTLNGSSAVGTGTQFTLQLNLSCAGSFAGNKVVYTAARDVSSNNSGWRTMGVTGVPPLPSTFPNPTGMSPSSGNTLSQTITFTYQDQTSAANLQTVWALVNTAIDGRAACYVAYYRPGNQLYLYPDNGDGSQATNITLAGSNTISNSQCTVSAQGSQVQVNGNTLTVTLPIAFKTAFAGFKGVWLAA